MLPKEEMVSKGSEADGLSHVELPDVGAFTSPLGAATGSK